ncbi:MAG: hypothetical protein LBQ37_02490 [Elusimicrobiota bacterium]|jgi:hypothetical protein|nr:hypothetical protein [Elusimicrobiota bacterium]
MDIIDGAYLRKQNIGKVKNINLFEGDRFSNLSTKMSNVLNSQKITPKTEVWQGSEAQAALRENVKQLREKVKNANTGFDYAAIKDLITGYLIDVARQQDDLTDYTDTLLKTISDSDMPQIVSLRNYAPYIGQEKVVAGANDSVPLIEETLPQVKPIEIKIKAFGHKNSLRDLVFNPFYSVERLMESVARITVDNKNKDCIGKIVSATYNAAHSQAADTTGANFDLKLYNTIKKAIKKGLTLFHPLYTKQMLGNMHHDVYLLVNPVDLYDIQPVIDGSLERLSGVNQLVGRLPITGIIPYAGGLQDGLVWGKEVLSFPGVPQGTAFAVIKTDLGGFNLVKRELTLEQGVGETLQLSTEERAWYRIGETFLDWLIASTIKITLPTA